MTLPRTSLLATVALLAACGPPGSAGDAGRPSVRFECAEACGSFKTVFPGETPPPCCGVPMDPGDPSRAPEDGPAPGSTER